MLSFLYVYSDHSILECYNPFSGVKLSMRSFFVIPSYSHWKSIVKTKIRKRESHEWHQFCTDHPGMHVAQECLANVPPEQFWSIADNYPDLVKCLHVQIRLAGNFGLNRGAPWLSNTEDALCFICKENVENVNHFLLECREFCNNFDSIWLNLR